MVAVAGLVAHAVVCAARTETAIQGFVFEEKLGRMDEGSIHLIIYRRRAEDVVDALPLALITVSASDTVLTSGRLSEVMEVVAT